MLKKLQALVPKGWRSFFVFPLLALFLFTLHFFRLVNFHEEDTLDLRFKMRGERAADPAITVVVVDDESLKSFGQWPWPRSTHGVFLELISQYRPKMVFFDMLFTEPSSDPEEDRFFIQVVHKAGNVILPFFYQAVSPFRAEFPIKPLLTAARHTAFVNAVEDADGHIRRTRAFLKTDSETFYSPAFLMASALGDAGDPLQGVPLDSRGNFWINYPGGVRSFTLTSYAEVVSLQGEGKDRLKELFENKLVLVGHMATGTTDLKHTPFSNQLPGVMVHAGVLHTLLSRQFLRPLNGWLSLILLLFLSCGSALIFRKFSPAYGFIVLLVLEIAYFLTSFLVFSLAGWILPLTVPITALLASYIASLFMKYTEIFLQKEMSQRELAMAASIQEQFLPQAAPVSAEMDMAFEARFTKQVGGDLYDWIDLGGGKYGICIGDVSGKGMPAAIYMAKTLSDFRSLSKKDKAPEKVLEELNTLMLANPASGMFLTLVYGIVDTHTRKFSYASAGHELTVAYRAATGQTELLTGPQGMPLGMFEVTYEGAEASFEKGDAFLFYSDGVKELRSPKGEEYGVARLQAAFKTAVGRAANSSAALKDLFGQMQVHQGKTQAHDDRTLVCLRFSV